MFVEWKDWQQDLKSDSQVIVGGRRVVGHKRVTLLLVIEGAPVSLRIHQTRFAAIAPCRLPCRPPPGRQAVCLESRYYPVGLALRFGLANATGASSRNFRLDPLAYP